MDRLAHPDDPHEHRAGRDIGLEIHTDGDQFLRVEQGRARVQMGTTKDDLNFDHEVGEDSVILVPAGTWHNVTNIGQQPLKLYAIYGPPEHPYVPCRAGIRRRLTPTRTITITDPCTPHVLQASCGTSDGCSSEAQYGCASMTTLHGSKKNLTISIGFFVLVAAGIGVSTLVRGSTVLGVIFLVIAVGLVALAVILQRTPANELRITPNAIELARPKRTIGSLASGDTDGHLEIRREIFQGRTFWSLVAPGAPPRTGISVDDFDPDEIQSAAEANGWTVSRVV